MIVVMTFVLFLIPGPKEDEDYNIDINMEELKLTSSAFTHNGSMPSKYTCDGEDINPPLSISGVDPDAKSLVLIMDDPDVPKYIREDGMWDHWIVFNMPITISEIKEGEEPEGMHGEGTSGNVKYHGPCPPDREHRYIFQLYSLDTELDIRDGAGKEVVKRAMKGHMLQKTELIGLYKKINS